MDHHVVADQIRLGKVHNLHKRLLLAYTHSKASYFKVRCKFKNCHISHGTFMCYFCFSSGQGPQEYPQDERSSRVMRYIFPKARSTYQSLAFFGFSWKKVFNLQDFFIIVMVSTILVLSRKMQQIVVAELKCPEKR